MAGPLSRLNAVSSHKEATGWWRQYHADAAERPAIVAKPAPARPRYGTRTVTKSGGADSGKVTVRVAVRPFASVTVTV